MRTIDEIRDEIQRQTKRMCYHQHLDTGSAIIEALYAKANQITRVLNSDEANYIWAMSKGERFYLINRLREKLIDRCITYWESARLADEITYKGFKEELYK